MEKQVIHWHGKDYYLLGQDKDGIKYWLEEPSWDCGWYWGFGYIETFTNNSNPEQSKDIVSHEHTNHFLDWWTNINGNQPKLVDFTFSEKKVGNYRNCLHSSIF